jgi:hypothetical protein
MSPFGSDAERLRGMKSTIALTLNVLPMFADSWRFTLLTMNDDLPRLSTESKVMARESPVSAGSPRELIALLSGSPRNTHESGTRPAYSGNTRFPRSGRRPVPLPCTQKNPVST